MSSSNQWKMFKDETFDELFKWAIDGVDVGLTGAAANVTFQRSVELNLPDDIESTVVKTAAIGAFVSDGATYQVHLNEVCDLPEGNYRCQLQITLLDATLEVFELPVLEVSEKY